MKQNLPSQTAAGKLLSKRRAFVEGMRDGIPIALGYLAVSFTLGIAARNAGMDAIQGFLMSILNLASAGEYAGIMLVASDAPYWEMALITLVTNARYLLMSCALSQKFAPSTPFVHRLGVGYAVTDELFGIAIARPGSLNPFYSYGAFALSIPAWSFGTAAGVIAGNILPARAVSALSVALYGMFIAIIIPPARKNRVVAVLIALCFALSWGATVLPPFSGWSDGMRTIALTVLLAGAAALFFPVKDEEEAEA